MRSRKQSFVLRSHEHRNALFAAYCFVLVLITYMTHLHVIREGESNEEYESNDNLRSENGELKRKVNSYVDAITNKLVAISRTGDDVSDFNWAKYVPDVRKNEEELLSLSNDFYDNVAVSALRRLRALSEVGIRTRKTDG